MSECATDEKGFMCHYHGLLMLKCHMGLEEVKKEAYQKGVDDGTWAIEPIKRKAIEESLDQLQPLINGLSSADKTVLLIFADKLRDKIAELRENKT
jgi:hypothetical protein